MPEVVTHITAKNYIHVESYGEVSLSEVQASLEKVLEFHKDFNCKKLIVDVSQQKKPLTLLDAYLAAKKVKSVLPSAMRLAYVVAPAPAKEQLFFKKVTHKQKVDLEVFHCVEAALNWLENKEQPGVLRLFKKPTFPSMINDECKDN